MILQYACRKVFCLYILSTLILSILLYFAITSHLNLLSNTELLHKEVTYILRELSEIALRHGCNQENEKAPFADKENSEKDEKDLEYEINNLTQFVQKELSTTKKLLEQVQSQKYPQRKTDHEIVRADFAMASLSGEVVSITGKPYTQPMFPFSWLGLELSVPPVRKILEDGVKPGDCYAFVGSKNNITVKLFTKVLLDSVSIGHITESMSPSGNISSAPKEFAIFGLRDTKNNSEYYFGTYLYNIHIHRPLQTFNLMRYTPEGFRYVKFAFLTNNGHPNYTCIYRISVHGKPEETL